MDWQQILTKARAQLGGGSKSPTKPQNDPRGLMTEYDEWANEGAEQAQPRRPLISFGTMRRMYMQNEWVRACVDSIVDQVTSTDWDITPTTDALEKAGKKTVKGEYGVDKPVPSISGETEKHVKEVKGFFRNPNRNKESWKSILKKVARDLAVMDAGVLEVVRDTRGRPLEVYALDAQTVEIQIDEHGVELSYVQRVPWSGKILDVQFTPQEVIYFINNPRSDSPYGISPLETLITSVAADLFANKYNAQFFENNATPRGLLDLGVDVGEDQLRRFRSYFYAELQGKPHRWLITSGGAKFTPVSMSNKDMEFIQYQQWLAKKILAVYQLNSDDLGLTDGSNRAISYVQRKILKSKAIYPFLDNLAEHINTELIATFGYDDIEFKFLLREQEDKAQQAQIDAVYLQNAKITINEARRRDGEDPVPWGDRPYAVPVAAIPPVSREEQKKDAMEGMMMLGGGGGGPEGDDGGGGGQKIDQRLHSARNGNPERGGENDGQEERQNRQNNGGGQDKDEPKEEVAKPKLPKGALPNLPKSAGWGTEGAETPARSVIKALKVDLTQQRRIRAERHLPMLAEIEGRYTEDLVNHLNRLKANVRAAILTEQKALKPDYQTLLASILGREKMSKEWVDGWTDIIARYDTELARVGWGTAWDGIVTTGYTPVTRVPQGVIDAIWDYASTYAAEYKQRREMEINTVIEDGVTNGMSMNQIADLVDNLFGNEDEEGDWSYYDATRIARTETIKASNYGRLEAYREAGVSKKQWLTALDPCPFCAEMNGMIVGLDEDFVSPDDYAFGEVDAPPLHPNCRCAVLPVVEGLSDTDLPFTPQPRQ